MLGRNPKLLLVLLAASLLPRSAQAWSWNWLDYFLSVPGVCTASNPNDPGTFNYIYSLGRSCDVPGRGSVPLYGFKGGWSEENYVAHNGWLYFLSELHPNLCGGSWGYRELEQQGSGAYGIAWAKLTTPGYESWTNPYFFLHCGPSCKTDQLNILQEGNPAEQALLGTIWDKLRDCRSGVCKPPIPMEVVMTRGYLYPHSGAPCGMHYENVEEYWYGRADITPNDGIPNPRSIGFVRFVELSYNHSTCSYDATDPAGGWNAYLKNCSVAMSCPYC